jgi:hypothetical protein
MTRGEDQNNSMTKLAAGEIDSENGDASASLRNRQTIHRLFPWPPSVTWSFGHSVVTAATDILVDVEWIKPADGIVGVRLCNRHGQEYGVELCLVPPLIEATLQRLKPGMTLLEIGELDVAEASVSAPSGAAIDAAAVPSAIEP